MSTIKYYQYCSVPLCINNINRTPDKLFIPVPHDPDRRKKWMKLARRDWKKQSIKSMIYFCEDHFDLPNDMENYMQYRIQGYIKKIRMKAGCLPSRFACQLDRKGTAPCADRNVIVKRKRQTLVEEALKEAANEEMPKCTEVKGNPGICRCCMSEGCYKDLGSEYSWMGDTEVYADMLLDCFDISITQHNEGPNGPNRLICEVCITRLRDACNFKKQVMDSEKKFIDMIGRGQFKPQVMVHQKVMKVELDDDGIDDTVEYLEEDMEFTDADDEPLKRPSPQPSASTLQLKAKRGRPRKSALTKHETKKEDKPKASKAVVKDVVSVKDAPLNYKALKEDIIRFLAVLLDSSNVMPFRWFSGKYMCFYCPCVFIESSRLKLHTVEEHTKPKLRNVITNYKQVKIKLDISDLCCSKCPKQFTDLIQLLQHSAEAHESRFNKELSTYFVGYKLSDEMMPCLICGEAFPFFGTLLKHVHKYHNKCDDFICEICGQSFINKGSVRDHIKRVHRSAAGKCLKCDKQFPNEADLKTHLDEEHASLYKCHKCTETFKSNYLKRCHVILFHDEKRFQFTCDQCPKIFITKSRLLNHKSRVHLKEKKYTCEVCGYRAYSKDLLTSHKVKHNNSRPFECEFCKKTFQRQKTLTYHRRIHTNDKRYKCKECGKAFVQHTSWKLHMRVHHSMPNISFTQHCND